MSGIAGIVERDPARPVDPTQINRMVETLRHRGPDQHGQLVRPGVGLGMRRLSVIDVRNGQQPFASEDGSTHLVANGEIYNHAELRRELVARGHRFRSRSDVEVVLHGYEAFGVDVLTRLRGMFAFALWDANNRRLFAGRDRAGEKPLFYAQTPQRLLFGSEMKALLVRPEVSREMDFEALDQFLTYEYVLTPRTIFADVRTLPPAHYLIYERGSVKVERYWDVASVPVRTWTEDEAASALREALSRAVAAQTMSDVPLGAFLSGDVDSTAIVGMMAERAGGRPVATFSLGFDAAGYDELPRARTVASHFGTDHREGVVDPDLATLFERVVAHFDEPFADASLFPTFLVSQIARQHVTAALFASGGGTLFGGYETYRTEALARRVSTVVPDAALRLLSAATALLPPSDRKYGVINRLRRFALRLATAPRNIAHYRWLTFLDVPAKRHLYTPALRRALVDSDVYAPIRRHLQGAHTDDLLNRQLYADLQVFLSDDELVKVDRASMATSLETRAPFLDVDVMELAFSMPGSLKIRNGERQYILKRAMRPLLPEPMLRRPGAGFSVPTRTWLRQQWAPLMQDLLGPDQVLRRGWFEPAEVARRVDEHLAGRRDHAHLLFSLMVLERWSQRFLD
jgi:asparagine synthase (glutamine-hydrolysing)